MGMWFAEDDGFEDSHGLFCCGDEECFRWMKAKSQIPMKLWSRLFNYWKYSNWGISYMRSVRLVRAFKDPKKEDEKEDASAVKVKVEAKAVESRKSARTRRKRKATRARDSPVTQRKRKRAPMTAPQTSLVTAIHGLQRCIEQLKSSVDLLIRSHGGATDAS